MIRASFLLLGILVFTTTCLGQLADRPVNSTISHVTVYMSGAQVTRTASLEMRPGGQRLVFKELSEEVDPASVQVHAGDGVRILGVKHRLDHGSELEGTPEISRLDGRLKEIERKLQDEKIQIGILQNEEQRLQKNETINSGDRGLTLEQLRGINEYVKERVTAIRSGNMERQRAMEALQEEAQKIHLQLGQLRSKKPRATSDLLVEVEVTGAIRSTFTLRYVVRSAGWSPQYDIRVRSVNAPFALTYKASVHQSSGEDWSSVALELSSGDPQNDGIMPEMQVWRLDVGTRPPGPKPRSSRPFDASVREVRGIVRDSQTGEPLPFVTITVSTADGEVLNSTPTGFDGYYAIAIPPGGRKIGLFYIAYGAQSHDIKGASMNFNLEPSAIALSEFEVVQYSVPLIDRDGGSSGGTVRREDISRMPGRTAGSSVRGARTENSAYYQDGVKVIKGGIPANFGDQAASSAEAVVRQRPTHFAFAIAMPYTIPSDGQLHTVAIKEHEVNSNYRYYSIPRLDPSAYLFAKATGWDDLDLIPGPANLFFEGTFIGESYLDSEQVGDTLDISLGRDRSIVIERKRSKEMSRQQLLGNRRVETIGWEIELRNTKAEPVDVVIMDQIPVSVRQEIDVSLQAHDATIVDAEKGFLTWRVALPARANELRHYAYSVRAPRAMRLVLE